MTEDPSRDNLAREATQALEFIQRPTKLLRITSMIRELLNEVRQSPLDEAARTRLRGVYERSLTELKDALSEGSPAGTGGAGLPA
jgi:hypothetical protein